ncbi:hypothetical protein CQA57_03200 [Helicobacter anseris]|uniref:PpiC domain-containing protein n=1 Tax=Helicobacter anseris TaxID=375926 RepID=A0A3D8JB36_9HELI|nr:peptidylprolyl isomerase [Helicobacter anseris]RDU74111.1 hypothetical protein CQA57_03200 [Helicobacter anseris]
MLEWMQKHKKYLVVTIWISVIALISAGMVGWNPSGFSLTGDNIAKVGKIKINQQEFQNSYQRVFNEYNQLLGGQLDLEQAKSFGIEQIALRQLIQKAQLQNFAYDLGLRVSNQEVITTITQDKTFFSNQGIFDEQIYRRLLKENNLSIKFFEQSIKDALLIQKLLTLFSPNITELEQKTIGSTIQLTDTIEYKMIETSPLKQKITSQQIQDFWEKNKEQYKKDAEAKIKAVLIDIRQQPFTLKDLQQFYNEDKTLYLNENGELPSFEKVKEKVQYDFQLQEAKKQAIKMNQKLKEEGFSNLKSQEIVISINQNISEELSNQLSNTPENGFIKPTLYNENFYIIGEILNFKPQSIKTLQEAKKEVVSTLEKSLQFEELKEEAQKQLDSFSGKVITINNLNPISIEELDKNQVQFIIHQIFASQNTQGIIMLDSRAFLYRITKQVLPQDIPDNLIKLVQDTKSQFIDKTLMHFLENKYPAKIYNKQIFK